MPLNKEIRARARSQLKGRWGTPILVFFVFTVIMVITSFFPILVLHLAGPLLVGVSSFCLKFIDEKPASVSNLFDGFKNTVSSIALYFWMLLWIVLWSLLLIIPGIIKAISYSMCYYVLADNPEVGVREALKISQRITEGYKGRIFLLYLSFIGWALLSFLTLGIGYLWLMPYINISFANLFKELKAEAIANKRFTSELAGAGQAVSS